MVKCIVVFCFIRNMPKQICILICLMKYFPTTKQLARYQQKPSYWPLTRHCCHNFIIGRVMTPHHQTRRCAHQGNSIIDKKKSDT